MSKPLKAMHLGVEISVFDKLILLKGDRLLVSSSAVSKVFLVDLKAGKVLKRLSTNCGDLLAVWPDESKFAMSHCADEPQDRQIQIYQLATGKLMRTITVPSHLLPSHLPDNCPKSEAGAQVFVLNFLSSDVPLIASYDSEFSTDDQPRIHLWDFKNGRLIRSFPQSNNTKDHPSEVGRICDMAVSQDGKILAARPGQSALLWDSITGKLLWSYQGNDGIVFNGMFLHAAFAPDKSFCALHCECDGVNKISIVDMKGRLLRQFVVCPSQKSSSILNLKITPDSKDIVVTTGLYGGKGDDDPGPDDGVRVYDVITGAELRHYSDAHWVTTCDVSRDGKYVVTGNLAGDIKTWTIP